MKNFFQIADEAKNAVNEKIYTYGSNH